MKIYNIIVSAIFLNASIIVEKNNPKYIKVPKTEKYPRRIIIPSFCIIPTDRNRIINAGNVLLNGINPSGTISKIEPTKTNIPLILIATVLFITMLNRWGVLIFSKKLNHFNPFLRDIRSFSAESVLVFILPGIHKLLFNR